MNRFGILIFIPIAILCLTACERPEITPESQPNQYVEDYRRHRDFTAIKAGKSVNLEVKVGEDFSVIVRSPESGFDDLKTEVEGDSLVITSRPSRKGTGVPIIVLVTLPELTRLDLWGSSKATVKNVRSENLTLQSGGESVLIIEGETNNAKMVATGVGRIDAEKLRSNNCEIKAAGASQVTVWTLNELSGEAHGASKIFYVGEPKKLLQSVIGAGQILKK
jgi:Putative auto-transporter adhesin, head GIN domain